MVDRPLDGFGISGFAKLDELCSFVQDIPDDFADPVSNGPNCLNVSETDHKAFENRLKMASVGSGGRLSCLAQQPSQEAIPFRGTGRMVLPRALIGTGANTDPGS